MFSLPTTPLPRENWLLATLFVVHYSYRAVLAPLVLNPYMSPIHISVIFAALAFNIANALSIGGWLAGYGPTTAADWAGRAPYVQLGVVIWAAGFIGNVLHDDELREIRRAAKREQREKQKEGEQNGEKKNNDEAVGKVYKLPESMLFELVLYPHFLCEWVEWAGFWLIGGLAFVPARNFLFNEIATMTPRAVTGRGWYLKTFGREKVGKRKAVIPGIL
jgi:3-oxo-5-alpha-steroid 4-dehydrogenase 1